MSAGQRAHYFISLAFGDLTHVFSRFGSSLAQSIFPGNTVPASGIVRGDRAALSTIFASLDRPNVLEGAFGRDGARILSAHPALLAHWSVLNAFTWSFMLKL